MENLKALIKSLSKKGRVEVLDAIKDNAMRNLEISARLKVRKERVSEALRELLESKVAVRFRKGSLIGEKHAFYVGTPLAKDIAELDERVEMMRGLLPSEINDFSDGIGYLLKYYMEADVDVVHSTIKTKKGRKVKLEIKRDYCGKEECEILCEPIIKGIVNKFGRLEDFKREKCRFNVSFWYGG